MSDLTPGLQPVNASVILAGCHGHGDGDIDEFVKDEGEIWTSPGYNDLIGSQLIVPDIRCQMVNQKHTCPQMTDSGLSEALLLKPDSRRSAFNILWAA